MQRSHAFVLTIVLLVMICLVACAEQKNVRVINRLSFSEAEIASNVYRKKVAVLTRGNIENYFQGQADNLLIETLIETITSESNSIVMSTPRDNNYPEFLNNINLMDNPGQRAAILSTARTQGYFALIEARVSNFSLEQKVTGVLFFRKMRSYITVTLAMDVYCAPTFTKLSAITKSNTVKVDARVFEEFKMGSSNPIAKINDAIVDMAEGLGEEAAEAIDDARWMTVILNAEKERAILAAGQSLGLNAADWLTVFDGQRIVDGPNGEKYVIAGYKTGDIQIDGFDGNHALAKISPQSDIKPGDIAVVAEQD